MAAGGGGFVELSLKEISELPIEREDASCRGTILHSPVSVEFSPCRLWGEEMMEGRVDAGGLPGNRVPAKVRRA